MNDDLAPADSRPEPTTPAPKPEEASARGESPTGSTPGSEPSTEGGSGTTSTSTGAPRRRRRRGGRGRGGARPKPEGSDSEAGSEAPEAPEGSQEGSETAEAGRGSGSSGGRASSTTSRPRSSGGSRRPPAKKETEPTPGDAEEGAEKGSSDSEKADGAARAPRPRRRAPAKPKTEDAEAPNEDSADAVADGGEAGEEGSEGTSTGAPRRRRRRGGRGRGRGTGQPKPEGEEGGPSAAATSSEGEEAKPRQRQRSGQKDSGGRQRSDQSKGSKEGKEAKEAQPMSTRLSAKAQRGSRSGSPRGRRRDTLPLVRRVQDKVMVITEHGERDQIAVLEDRDLVQHYITRVGAHSMVGNLYMARVQNVLPGMEAAFLDIGRGRNAVLYAGEVNYDEEVEGQPQRIEHALKSGQAVMTQVTKDPIGGKGARLTAQVSLPGRYLVLVPNSQVFGISRRLPDEERKRLRAAIKKAKPDGHGIIVRTAAEGASEEALAQDVERLVAEWDEIAKKSKKAKAPSVLYEEPELTVRVVRDLFNDEEFKEMVTDSPRIYEIVTDYLRDVAPDLLPKVRLHEGSLSAFEEFHIVEQIHKALDRKVWLPSGGYLVIDRTEAMTVIDVNTGKHVGKTNLEETVVKTNLEAAEEVARQLRLRDIGGMIIVDFIDMLLEQNKKKVIATLKEALAKDKTRTQVFDISPLGLLEITRKRVSAGLLESFSETCPTCEGRGILLTLEV